MKKWIIFLGLLTIAGTSINLGLAPIVGVNLLWLSLALVALFAASDARFWKLLRR